MVEREAGDIHIRNFLTSQEVEILRSRGDFLLSTVGFQREKEVKKRFEEFLAVYGSTEKFKFQEDFKFQRALFSQRLANDLYLRLIHQRQFRSVPGDREVGEFVRLLRKVSYKADNYQLNCQLGSFVRRVLNSSRCQAGLMDCLNRGGFIIIQPQAEEEVREVDLHGVDFSAVSPKGEIYFIDAKSRVQVLETEFRFFSVEERIVEPMLNWVWERLKKEGQEVIFPVLNGRLGIKYAFVEAYLPSSSSFMDSYGCFLKETSQGIARKISALDLNEWG